VISHILDRPALHALQTRHAHHAQTAGRAMRYDPDVAPFLTYEDESPETLAALVDFVPPDRFSIVLQADQPPLLPGTRVEMEAEGVQMLADEIEPPPAGELAVPVIPLVEADVPEMVALAALTRPGPFLPKTHLLGGYIGIRDGGRLVAMAGERFKVPGFTEVSAVCTHPDHRGKGYAAHLTLMVAARIAERGETPFLHTFAANTPALRLYEKLGFRLRRSMRVTVLRRT